MIYNESLRTYFENCSFHNLSLRAPLADQAANVQPMPLSERQIVERDNFQNYGGKEGSMYLVPICNEI